MSRLIDPTPTPPLILASASPRRRELLAGLELPFLVDPADLDETGPDRFDSRSACLAWVGDLALAKARAVAARHRPGRWVLGADTIVVLGDEVLQKPADEADAVAMIQRLQGRTHTVITAVALVPSGRSDGGWVEAVETDVTFHPLTRAQASAYVAAGESLDKAGAYAAQGRGALIIEKIDGCYFNVVGLPVSKVGSLLARAGFDIWSGEADAPDEALG